MAMSASGLDVEPEGLDAVAGVIATVGHLLATGLDEDVSPCGGDGVSEAIFGNLNARLRWLVSHFHAGHDQASAAADIVADNARSYRGEDAAAAAAYAGMTPAATAPASAISPGPVRAPDGVPPTQPIPDISGTEGEELARALESGAGPGPALAMAARLTALATQADAASSQLAAAQAQLIASGQSAVHPPLMARLTRALAWSSAVAGHAADLSASFTAAAGAFSATYAAVGPSPAWRTLKDAYREAAAKSRATLGATQPEADALDATLTAWQNTSTDAVSGYQETGYVLGTHPGDLPGPGLAPDSSGTDEPADDADHHQGRNNTDGGKPDFGEGIDDEAGGDLGAAEDTPLGALDEAPAGIEEMLSPLLGSLGSLGQANPLQSVAKIGEQLGQQVGQFGQQAGQLVHQAAQTGQHPPVSPIKANPLANTHLSAGHGGGKGVDPGGGIPAGSHPSSAPPATSASPTPTQNKPTGATPSAGSGAGSGMGMVPMSRGAGGATKSSAVPRYPGEPLDEAPNHGTAGVVGETTKPEPAVDPSAKKAVRERLAKRKLHATDDDH